MELFPKLTKNPVPHIWGNMRLNEDPLLAAFPRENGSTEEAQTKPDSPDESLPIGAVSYATFKATMDCGSKTYFCLICNSTKTGCYSDYLRHHLVHTGEKPFACPYCSFKSKLVGNLKKHISRKHPV